MEDKQIKTIGEACIKIKPDTSAIKELLLAILKTIEDYEQKQNKH